MKIGGLRPFQVITNTTIMARKRTYEEEMISRAADIIMQTIHMAANRIADRYEAMLMNEVKERIRVKESVREEVNAVSGEVLADEIGNLARWYMKEDK